MNANIKKTALFVFVIALTIRIFFLLSIKNHPILRIAPKGLDSYHFHKEAIKISNGNIYLKGQRFHQAPFYSYFLGLIYFLLGTKIISAISIQIIISSLSALLIYMIAYNLSKNSYMAFISGLIWAFYGPSIFYSILILKTTITVFFILLLFYITVISFYSKKTYFFIFISGILSGILYTLRPNFIILGFFVFCFYLIKLNKNKLKILLFFLLGVVLIPSFFFIRNIKLKYPAFQISSVGKRAIVMGLLPDDKRIGWDDAPQAETVLRTQLKNKNIFQTLIYVAKENIKNPAKSIALQTRKILAFLSWYEYPNNYNYYLLKNKSPILKYSPFSFFFLFFTFFFCITVKNCKYIFKKYYLLFFIFLFLSIFPFYPFSRFRMPIAAMFSIMSGPALIQIFSLYKEKRLKDFIIYSSIVAIMLIFPSFLEKNTQTIRYQDYFNFGNFYIEDKKLPKSIFYYKKALEINPSFFPAINNLGFIYLHYYNNKQKAIQLFEKSLKIYPHQPFLKNVLKQLKNKKLTQ